MKITNKHRLPKVLVDAIKQSTEEYTAGDSFISASAILTSPRQYWLRRRHKKEIVQDAADLVWSLLGTSVHYMAEMAGKRSDDAISEERFFSDILGEKVSAQIDYYSKSDKTLTDFKVTTVYSMKSVKKEWEYQLNMQRWLMHKHGYDVDELQIVAIGRDWSKRNAQYNSDYPSTQVKVIKIPIWTIEETEKKLEDIVARLVAGEQFSDDTLPECTKEERWEGGTVYAVKKEGSKRAVKLYDSKIEAISHAGKVSGFVEERAGSPKKCEFCQVSKWCNQYNGN